MTTMMALMEVVIGQARRVHWREKPGRSDGHEPDIRKGISGRHLRHASPFSLPV